MSEIDNHDQERQEAEAWIERKPVKHFLQHTTSGLKPTCDEPQFEVTDLTANERRVNCGDCMELLEATEPPDREEHRPLADEPGGDNISERAYFGEL